MPTDDPILAVHCNSRKVSHMLLGTRKLIKQCSFSAVLITYQCKGKFFTVRQRIFLLPVMKLSSFTIARMMFFFFFSFIFNRFRLMRVSYLNIIRIFQTDTQFISMNTKFYGVSHGSIFHHCNFCPLYKSHI